MMNENEFQSNMSNSQPTTSEKNIPTESNQTSRNSYTGGTYSGSMNTGNSYAGNVYSSNTNVGTSGNNNANYQSTNTNYQYSSMNGSQSNGGYQNAYSNTYANSSAYAGKTTGSQMGKPPKKKGPHKMSGIWKKAIAGFVFAICFGIFAGVSFYAVKSVNEYIESKKGLAASAEPATQETPANEDAVESEAIPEVNGTEITVVTDVTDVVERVMPSVVSVTNKYMAQQQDFFGETLESEQSASGSGIIVGESDTELLIATNYHVVEDADSLMVQFIDGTEAEAQMKGSDSGMDIAVMAVQLEKLSEDTKNAIVIAKLGDSESLKVGEPAIAIGNALGYGQSVTTGVISAVNRSIVDETQSTPTGTGSKSSSSLIQTDAAINPGNSGGALLNIKGEVVGINSNKIGGSVIEGMGYAIPISSAKPIIEDLMTKTTKAKVADGDKAYLGISGVDVTADAAGTYGLPEGVYVAQVYEDTAAANAGLVKGDIITKFDGSSVNSMEELQNMLQYYSAGTTVDVTIQQGSPTGYQEKTVAVTLGTKPDRMVQ